MNILMGIEFIKKRFEELKNGILTQIDTIYFDNLSYVFTVWKSIIISRNGINIQIPIFFQDNYKLHFSLTSEDGINYNGYYPDFDESDNEVKIKISMSIKIGENEIVVNQEVSKDVKMYPRTFLSKITFDSKKIHAYTKTKNTEEVLEISSNKKDCWKFYKDNIIIQ